MNLTYHAANMHEFYTLDSGRHAVYILDKVVQRFDRDLRPDSTYNGSLLTTGFKEVDLVTGETLFEWFANDHVDVEESLVAPPEKKKAQMWDNV